MIESVVLIYIVVLLADLTYLRSLIVLRSLSVRSLISNSYNFILEIGESTPDTGFSFNYELSLLFGSPGEQSGEWVLD